jgi:hypothetical protein
MIQDKGGYIRHPATYIQRANNTNCSSSIASHAAEIHVP